MASTEVVSVFNKMATEISGVWLRWISVESNIANKAVVSPNSGTSQESSRTGKTKRSQSSQGSVKTCEHENKVNRLLAAKMSQLAAHFPLITC